MEHSTIPSRSEPKRPTFHPDSEPTPSDVEARSRKIEAFLLEVERMTQNLSDEQGPIPDYPSRRHDEDGRQLPFTPEELALRSEIFRRSMIAIDAMGQEPPGSDEEFMRALDSHRPEGMKRFEGYY